MEELIKALNIFKKYMKDDKYPTWCEHDVLGIKCDPSIVSAEDIKILDELGIFPDEENEDCFISYKYGS